MTDKDLFAIRIKEGLAMNHGDVRECSWKGARVWHAKKPWRVYPGGSGAVCRA